MTDSPTPSARRVALLTQALLRTGGIMPFPAATFVLREPKQAVSRALRHLEHAGAVVKARFSGEKRHVWLTRRRWTTLQLGPDEPSGDRAIRDSTDNTFVAWRTFHHDQLANQILYALTAPGSDDQFITQCEIDKQKNEWPGRRPDVIISVRSCRNAIPGLPVLAVEVELSNKSGLNGGWTNLARYCIAIRDGEGQKTQLGKINSLIIVAPSGIAHSVAEKIKQAAEKRYCGDAFGVATVEFYWIELCEDGTFGPVLEWQCGQPEPKPSVVHEVWNPPK